MAQSLANCSYRVNRSTDLDPNDDNKYSEIFEWICNQNLPQIEDETPPDSFYEVIDDFQDLYPQHYHAPSTIEHDMRLNIIEPHPHEFSTETILHLVQLREMHDVPELELEPEAKLELVPEPEPELVLEPELVPQVEPDIPETHTQQTQTDTLQILPGYTHYVHQRIRWQRQHSVWSLVKTLLLFVSLLHGSYLLCSYASRSGIMQRMLATVPAEATPPPPPTRPLPILIWTQLCRLARKLFHI